MAETLESDSTAVLRVPGSVDQRMGDSGPPVEEKDRKVLADVNAGEEVAEEGGARAEIDTSAPFESVKEAVSRFGGLGFWKPNNHHQQHYNDINHTDGISTPELDQVEWEEIDDASVEEQAAELEKELIIKEKDTLNVLKELEATKMIVEDLKVKLQTAESAVPPTADVSLDSETTNIIKENKENDPPPREEAVTVNTYSSSAPGLILMELKQAKLNLTRTTSDLADIRASVESYNRKIDRERMSLEKTRERLASNSSKINSLEDELNQTKTKLQLVKDGKDISVELQRLNREAEMYKKMGETVKEEVMKMMSEVEDTKARIKTTEIRLVAARKMKEAAKAAEAIAIAEINALENSTEQSSDKVTLTFEEFSSLTHKAQEASENTKKRVIQAMLQVDEADLSKSDILKRVNEAMEEVKVSKKALELALRQVDEANKAKLAVEEALRRWRSDNGQKRRSVQSNAKFKLPGPTEARRDTQMIDVNGISLVGDSPVPLLKPTLSIGQILSRKLMVAEDIEPGKFCGRRKVSLGQMLGKPGAGAGEISTSRKADKENRGASSTNATSCIGRKQVPSKRKKFGFARFSVLLPAKHSAKKKKKVAKKTL